MSQKFFALDLGHRYLKFCIAEENNFGVLTPLSLIDRKINSFKNGEIIDADLFAEEVIKFLSEVSQQIGQKVSEITLSFSAPYLTAYQAHGRAIVQGKNIRKEDLDRARKLAKMTVSVAQQSTLWEEPLYYLLDNSTNKIRDPIGMEARTVEVYLLTIQASISNISKIEQSFRKNKININHIIPNPIPASFAVLEKKDKENGVVLIDFGYHLTNVAVFKDGSLIDYKVFQFGWYDLVQELAILHESDLEETEQILENFLHTSDPEVLQKTKIKLGKKSINIQALSKIFEKTLNQLAKNCGLPDWFKKLKENYKLPGGAFILGSASHLPELQKIFRNLTSMPIKLAIEKNHSLGEKEHTFLNAWGLTLWQYREVGSTQNIWQKIKALWENFLIGR